MREIANEKIRENGDILDFYGYCIVDYIINAANYYWAILFHIQNEWFLYHLSFLRTNLWSCDFIIYANVSVCGDRNNKRSIWPVAKVRA